MQKQLTLTGLEAAYAKQRRKVHGGALTPGRRKERRPLHESKPLHLVLRSEHARGKLSFLHPRYEKRIATLIRQEARRSGVNLFKLMNVGNHLHLIVQPVKRRFFQRFLRVISGKIARLVTGAEKSRPFGKRFWDGLAFSRVLEWGRDFTNAKAYLVKNEIEALGWGDLLGPRKKSGGRPAAPPVPAG